VGPRRRPSLSAQGAPGSCRGTALQGHPCLAPRPPNPPRLPGGRCPPPLLPGTATLEMASGWLSVSTLTCWKPLQVALCRCLRRGERVGYSPLPPQITALATHSPAGSGRGWVPAVQLASVTARPPCPKAAVPRWEMRGDPSSPLPSPGSDSPRTASRPVGPAVRRGTAPGAQHLRHPSPCPSAPPERGF